MKISIEEEKLKEMIVNAFGEGEQWAVAYSTWFIPDEDKQREKREEAIKNSGINELPKNFDLD